jgi:hypothetical protein
MTASTLSSRPNLAQDALGWLNSRYSSLSIDRKAGPGRHPKVGLGCVGKLSTGCDGIDTANWLFSIREVYHELSCRMELENLIIPHLWGALFPTIFVYLFNFYQGDYSLK